MSIFEHFFSFLKQPIEEVKTYLDGYHINLKKTSMADVYLVQYTPETVDAGIPFLKGLIFNHKTGQILSLNPTPAYEFKDLDADQQNFHRKMISNAENIRVEQIYDGTQLRLAYFPGAEDSKTEGEWILSTNGVLDAHKAFWMNNVSFGEMFDNIESVNIDYNKLNENHVYILTMVHPMNVIVVNHEKPAVYHTTTINRLTGEEVVDDALVDTGIIPTATCDLTLEEVERNTINAHLDQTGMQANHVGYMICVTTHLEVANSTIVERFRFEDANYTRARQLRGHGNNLDFTVLTRILGNAQDLQLFLSYYPIYRDLHDKLVDRIRGLASKLFAEYETRYKRRQRIRVHHRHHHFLHELHQRVYIDRLRQIKQKVTFDHVHKFLELQPPKKLLYLLNYIHFDDNPKTEKNNK